VILMGENQKEDIMVLRHSTSHILAAAVKKLFPDAKLGIGPAIEDGFYYDFDVKEPFTPEDLKKIDEEMNSIIRKNLDFTKKDISKAEAKKMFKNEPYKLELIDELEGNTVSTYTTGDFIDLCKGPHIQNSKSLKSFKLIKTAGAYWKGSEKNKQLQRIYGVVFHEKDELKNYLAMLQEAEKRDHRKLGKDLNLIMTHEFAPGMPFFLPKGMTMLIELTKFVREYSYGEGYKEVRTPQLFNAELWKISGHWEHYRENMFCLHHAEDNMDMALKAMNCPGHMLVFKRDAHSYKDLPLRIAEVTTLHRNEKSGTLAGLTRVRALSQDDTHIFISQDGIFDEIKILLSKIKSIYKIFNLNIDEINLSTRPDPFMGKKETWDLAEESLKKALEDSGLKYKVDAGGGAFYGPKIDVKVKDALGRQWQLATIQLDYQMPMKFGLEYTDADGSRKTPVVIHRAILGTMERFLGIIIEHFAGKFPLWLSPVQVKILTIADRFNDYADQVAEKMKSKGLRVEVDKRAESISKKVRDAQLEKINYILVVGEKEIADGTVAIRTRDNIVQAPKKVKDFIDQLVEEVEKKKL
jgi:threonyl-tRNA synthetase